MTRITTTPLPLKDALLLKAFQAEDNRGKFTKYFEDALFKELKFETRESFASSNRTNVVRGLHLQNPGAQARIVWCPYGKIWDVIVDLRKNSPTYLKWHAEELSDENNHGMYVPRGFAHGFVALSMGAYVLYLADAPYSPETEKGISWNDPKIGIRWPKLDGEPVLSGRDAKFGNFDEKLHSY